MKEQKDLFATDTEREEAIALLEQFKESKVWKDIITPVLESDANNFLLHLKDVNLKDPDEIKETQFKIFCLEKLLDLPNWLPKKLSLPPQVRPEFDPFEKPKATGIDSEEE